jgi:hypothetical protein
VLSYNLRHARKESLCSECEIQGNISSFSRNSIEMRKGTQLAEAEDKNGISYGKSHWHRMTRFITPRLPSLSPFRGRPLDLPLSSSHYLIPLKPLRAGNNLYERHTKRIGRLANLQCSSCATCRRGNIQLIGEWDGGDVQWGRLH